MHQHSASCMHHPPPANQLSQQANKVRLLVTALILIGSFSLAELAVGLFSHSLALLADSGHMVSDCFALVLALLATWMAQRRKASHSAPGNYWVEVVAALVNGVGLVAIAFWIGWEAIVRLQSPPVEILSLPMLATASVGLGVNTLNIFLLHKDSHHDLNLRGAFLPRKLGERRELGEPVTQVPEKSRAVERSAAEWNRGIKPHSKSLIRVLGFRWGLKPHLKTTPPASPLPQLPQLSSLTALKSTSVRTSLLYNNSTYSNKSPTKLG